MEAILVARRDGRTLEERVRIYDREIERLMAAEPAYNLAPPNGVDGSAAPAQPAGFLFRF